MAKKKPIKPAKISDEELDALSLVITDDQLTYLLGKHGRLIKERASLKYILALEACMDPKVGVDITFNGEVTGHRRPSPGELFRIQQAFAKFNPADFASVFQNADSTAAGNMAAGMDDLDELSRATGGGAE